jgi:hypothetical protein
MLFVTSSISPCVPLLGTGQSCNAAFAQNILMEPAFGLPRKQ